MAPSFAGDDDATLRAAAQQQFARAEALRAALEAKTEPQTVKDYTELVSAYRHVMLITPRAPEVPAAIKEIGDLYRSMGEQFDRVYFNSAVETYGFLLREYPTTRYREETLLAIAQIPTTTLGQADVPQTRFEDFLKQYPRSPRAADARKALAEMAASKAPAPSTFVPTSASVSGPAPVQSKTPGEPPEVSGIRVWNADTYTRIVIDIGGQAKYQACARLKPRPHLLRHRRGEAEPCIASRADCRAERGLPEGCTRGPKSGRHSPRCTRCIPGKGLFSLRAGGP